MFYSWDVVKVAQVLAKRSVERNRWPGNIPTHVYTIEVVLREVMRRFFMMPIELGFLKWRKKMDSSPQRVCKCQFQVDLEVFFMCKFQISFTLT